MSTTHPLGPWIRRFLLEEVIADRNMSPNTQKSYRDTVRLLLRFMAERHAVDPTRLTVEHVTADVVRSFLTDLEQQRQNSIATRNQRLAALHSLFRFIGRQVPELVEHASTIVEVPLRRAPQPMMPYLEKAEMDAVLAAPDRRTPQGTREYALLLFVYNTGARAAEAVGVTHAALQLGDAPAVRIVGKGRKERHCPLWPHTAEVLRQLVRHREREPRDTPVFLSVRRQPLTRFGLHTLVERTVTRAAKTVPSLKNKRVSPHTIRHTTAVHLLRAGVDINTIRAWLGHVSLETTNRYAEVDLEMKAKALATCAITDAKTTPTRSKADWRSDRDLMAFLASL